MTLEGTNTWILLPPAGSRALVVDPGPDDTAHLSAVLAAVRDAGAEVGQVLLTHGHADHSAGARRFAELAAAPVRALDPAHRLGSEGLAGGVQEVDAGHEEHQWFEYAAQSRSPVNQSANGA
jgi:glyoxylase-like metal-dependent hydrolase (beta-lactamase superfamily II)